MYVFPLLSDFNILIVHRLSDILISKIDNKLPLPGMETLWEVKSNGSGRIAIERRWFSGEGGAANNSSGFSMSSASRRPPATHVRSRRNADLQSRYDCNAVETNILEQEEEEARELGHYIRCFPLSAAEWFTFGHSSCKLRVVAPETLLFKIQNMICCLVIL